jgi:hypothetical protein
MSPETPSPTSATVGPPPDAGTQKLSGPAAIAASAPSCTTKCGHDDWSRMFALTRRAVVVVGGVLLSATTVVAQSSGTTHPPPDVANEYRITAYPSYPISEKLTGFGYIGWVNKPDADYQSYYLGTGTFYRAAKAVQLWVGLISAYTDNTERSNLLELRPFTGVKFLGMSAKKWRYYNWTRYEMRLTETLDTDAWKTVHRVRNQTRLEIPLAPTARAWTPKSWYVLSDVEPIYRSDTSTIDPLRLRAGVGYIASSRLLVEFQYYAQYTRPDSGLKYTDNIFRLNLKITSKRGLLSLLDGHIDD